MNFIPFFSTIETSVLTLFPGVFETNFCFCFAFNFFLFQGTPSTLPGIYFELTFSRAFLTCSGFSCLVEWKAQAKVLLTLLASFCFKNHLIFLFFWPWQRLAMKIHVSENTKLLLDEYGGFSLEKRGTVDIKVKFELFRK